MSSGIDAILVGAPVTATGGLLFGPTNAPAPVNASDAIGTGYTKGGYIGEDGVTRTTDASDDKIKAWGGDTVKIVRTEHSITYTFTFLESANADILKLIHGAENVSVDGATGTISVNHTSALPERKAFVLDMADSGVKLREYIANGQLTTSGDAVFVHSDVIKYEVTIEAFPDANGVKAVSHMSDPTYVAPDAWEATTPYALNDKVLLSTGEVLQASTAGTSSSTEPVAPAVGATVADGSVTWTRLY